MDLNLYCPVLWLHLGNTGLKNLDLQCLRQKSGQYLNKVFGPEDESDVSSDVFLFLASHRPVCVEATEVKRARRSKTTSQILRAFDGPGL